MFSAVRRLVGAILVGLFLVLPSFGMIVTSLLNYELWDRWLERDPTFLPAMIVAVGVFLISSGAVLLLVRGWLRTRVVRVRVDSAPPTVGLFEKWFRGARAISFNGFGFRYLDFRVGEAGHPATATLWLTAAFFPIAPIARDELHRIGPTNTSGIPMVAQWSKTTLAVGDRLPVGRGARARVYAFYFGFFLPAIVAPVAAFVTIAIQLKLSAGPFWIGAAGVLAWGVGIVFVERRVMGLPTRLS